MNAEVAGADSGKMNYFWHIWQAIQTIFEYAFRMIILRTPVSYPGGPRLKKQSRKGKWPSRKSTMSAGWSFACDVKSHEVSQKITSIPLTGESAGRQIWYRNSKEEGSRASVSKMFFSSATSPNKDSTPSTPFKSVEELDFNPSVNPNSGDKVFRKLMIQAWRGDVPNEDIAPKTPKDAAVKGLGFYQMLQCEDGHWAGDYAGPMFLMPGLIIVLYVTKTPFAPGRREGMIQYLLNHQQEDGGWGTHIECASTMFGTVLSYVSLRLLGEASTAPHMLKAHQFICLYGGALYAPSWAKFWLAVLGVYDWKGINPIPSELWFLPRWFPFHPGKLWCHCRMVYLPMGYLYCARYTPKVEEDPLLLSLRKELYLQDYDGIDFNAYRQTCADIDDYSTLNSLLKVFQDIMVLYEKLLTLVPFLQSFRKAANAFAMAYIHAEDAQTNCIDIGPVNKALNMLAEFVDGGCDAMNPKFRMHIPRVDDYLWVAEDGVKMQGYNGSQCWDTSFAAQAIVEGGLVQYYPDCTRKLYSYLQRTQIEKDEEDREKWFRHQSKGGWPFSTAGHGWPISDCTSEGLKAVLALHQKGYEIVIDEQSRIPSRNLMDACDVLLSYHNSDGGWATYENNRGYGWYELLNPSEVFGDIMIDYSYVECSSATITALVSFSSFFPSYRTAEVLNAIQAGRAFLKSIQRPDGSWYGSWGVCFTYGTWFGIEGLIAAGESPESSSIQRAITFILSKQNANGGWGENYLSCVNKEYTSEEEKQQGKASVSTLADGSSGVVQTAWGVLALLAGECEDKIAIDRGIAFLMKKQLPTGDWAQEAITGVFNRSCGITYTAYRNIFPIWALGRYAKKYG